MVGWTLSKESDSREARGVERVFSRQDLMGHCQGCGFYSWLKVKSVQCGWLALCFRKVMLPLWEGMVWRRAACRFLHFLFPGGNPPLLFLSA